VDLEKETIKLEYTKFLDTKNIRYESKGKDISVEDIHPMLFQFQRDVTKWAVAKGRCAVFLDTGLGKTLIALEFSRLLDENTLIIAPLSVARQTVREGRKIDLEVKYVRSQEEVGDKGIYITNYEMLEKFNYSSFGTVVLDESSILKSISSRTRAKLIEACQRVPYRLCCTATPAPNDFIEVGNHAEFLGVCTRAEMLAMFFINANKEHTIKNGNSFYRKKGMNKDGTEWRLRHHGEKPFFRWLASWAFCMTKPSDLEYDDNGFILPPLNYNLHVVDVDYNPNGEMFFSSLKGIKDRAKIRDFTVEYRLSKVKELISQDSGQWIIWCGLDKESKELSKLIEGSVEVEGSDSPDYKAQMFEDFQDGKYQVLITKSKIGGFGLNMQNANNMIFFGLNDSWEMLYQSIRREWRFGQTKPVNVHIVISNLESEIYNNVMRKDMMAERLRKGLIEEIKTYEKEKLASLTYSRTSYKEDTVKGRNWVAMLGDSCTRLKEIPDESIDLSVYSPPFAELFTYTDSERDLGNCKDSSEFFKHYSFIIREVLRVTKPGRLSCVHTSDIPAMLTRDGYIGLKDFPGDVIRAHEKEGWTFVGRAFIAKNPQALRNGTQVMTPLGWHPIETLKVGDFVTGADGTPTKVLGVYPQGIQQLYRVKFRDGDYIDCHANHIWFTNSVVRNKSKLMTTIDILNKKVRYSCNKPKFSIPFLTKPVLYEKKDNFVIDPYLLGVLLGDGSISQKKVVEICTDTEILNKVKLPEGHILVKRKGSDKKNGLVQTAAIVYPTVVDENLVMDNLRKLGLQGCRAWEKFIPSEYIYSSIDARKDIIRGLIDTDGRISIKNKIDFFTTSEQLAKDVRTIMLSLGCNAIINKSRGDKYIYKGDVRYGRSMYRVAIQIFGDVWCPVTLKRKVDRFIPRKKNHIRYITDIDAIDNDKCTCIEVEATDGLFITENFVITHNSQAIRTKSKALLFAQFYKDSVESRPALADQILIFRKKGINQVPILPVENGDMNNEIWIEWANGIWLGISESDTLSFYRARGVDDEKHICPLQLGTIERCIKLYSNPNETILTPFMGIGSEAYQALKYKRKAIGIELKETYFNAAVENLNKMEKEIKKSYIITG